jgi:SAM-dependent methyltransferase
MSEEALPADLFARVDESDDAIFYQMPRLVQHIDPGTIAALTDYYAETLPAGGRVLDLMSSWVSHLPPDLELADVIGLGMNAAELAANPRLTDAVVQDLNINPALPFAAARFDAVTVAVSVQYLIRPVAVFAEIARVLAPGGRLIVAMSHRCFPTKAIRAFHQLAANDRIRLVAHYCQLAGGFAAAEFVDRSPATGDPLWIVTAVTLSCDKRRQHTQP